MLAASAASGFGASPQAHADSRVSTSPPGSTVPVRKCSVSPVNSGSDSPAASLSPSGLSADQYAKLPVVCASPGGTALAPPPGVSASASAAKAAEPLAAELAARRPSQHPTRGRGVPTPSADAAGAPSNSFCLSSCSSEHLCLCASRSALVFGSRGDTSSPPSSRSSTCPAARELLPMPVAAACNAVLPRLGPASAVPLVRLLQRCERSSCCGVLTDSGLTAGSLGLAALADCCAASVAKLP
mmetsp:Transcript_95818/g.309369  ORF Transcript_95818/g.309369 Transcript_95818/m.309369 type:complete len:242 (-) Transcript_95818:734-1459(-)